MPFPWNSRSQATAGRLQVSGRVLYVIENVTADSSTAGIAFQTQSAIVQARIKNFIVTSASGSAIRGVCEGFTSRGVAHEFRITNQRQIRSAFRRLQDEGLVLNSLFEGNLHILELKVADVNHEEGIWTACRPGGDLHRNFAMPAAGYFSFCLDGGSHYFKSEFFDWSDGTPILRMPQVLFRSEKRSYQRKPLHGSGVGFHLPAAGAGEESEHPRQGSGHQPARIPLRGSAFRRHPEAGALRQASEVFDSG